MASGDEAVASGEKAALRTDPYGPRSGGFGAGASKADAIVAGGETRRSPVGKRRRSRPTH